MKSISRHRVCVLFRSSYWELQSLEPRRVLAGDLGVAADVATVPNAASESTVTPGTTTERCSAASVVFIDASLADLGTLLNGVSSESEVVLLDSSQDFVDQVSAKLRNLKDVRELHVVTHGIPGMIHLGQQRIDLETLKSRHEDISAWKQAIAPDADLLLYGCEVGRGSQGTRFLTELAKLARVDVAASIDLTGSPQQAADWQLERSTGAIESSIAFSRSAQQNVSQTLSVTIYASGETGEEQFDLLIDGNVVQSWTATTNLQAYTYESPTAIAASQVVVRFNNDLYQPEVGFDRNLTVDKVVIDGVTFESESAETFSTGTWITNEGLRNGYGRGQVLHANGEFRYDALNNASVTWQNKTWIVNTPDAEVSVDTGEDELVIKSQNEASLWRPVELQVGQVYRLSVDAYRQVFSTQPDRMVPYASVGIDFRNRDGFKFGQVVLDTNSGDPAVGGQFREFVVPVGTASATMWVWLGDSTTDTLTSLRLRDAQVILESIAGDTTPPNAEFNPSGNPLVFNSSNSGESLSFLIRYTDNTRLNRPAQIRVTGPNGYDQLATSFTGFGNGVTEQTVVYGVFAEPRVSTFVPARNWDARDNGLYTVRLIPNTLIDQAGNVAPEQVLGTFTVAFT